MENKMDETPYYIFDYHTVKKRIQDIKDRLPGNARLCYAIKANAFLLHALKDEDILFEVCSEGELEICRAMNVVPEKIVFSGVMKNLGMVKKAVDYGTGTVTAESLLHLDFIAEAAKGRKQDVILRLTGGNQFGMSTADLEKAVGKISENPDLRLRGIHYFTGTQKKIKKIGEEVDFIQDYCRKLKEKFNLDFNSIEYGPGLSFDYFSGEEFAGNFDDLNAFSKMIEASEFEWTVEMGRFIASPCGKYYTKICDIKCDHDTNQQYLIIDGGINHINYYGQIMSMKVPPVRVMGKNAGNRKQEYVLCGSLCTATDVITRKISLPEPEVGDILEFSDIGAYSVTEGIYLFLSHDLPAVYGKDGENLIPLRREESTYRLNF